MTVAITHMLELLSNKDWNFSITVIAAFDSGSIGLACFLLLFLNNNADYILKIFFTLSTVSSVIYFLAIPESPKFLFAKKRDKEGIAVLNYIAWFNRSEFRVPEDAIFDSKGEEIEESMALNCTNLGNYRALLDKTHIST